MSKFVLAPRAAGTYTFWIKLESHLNRYSADPVELTYIVPVPADVTTFSIDGNLFQWSIVSNPWLAGYVIKFHYGFSLDWNSATSLSLEPIPGPPYIPAGMPVGPLTFMIKAIDSAGNESANTTNIFTEITDIPIANVLSTTDFHTTFLGTNTGCTVVANQLVATALDSYYGEDEQSFYDVDGVSHFEFGAYGLMQYITNSTTFPSVLNGSKMFIQLATEGGDLVVEYKTTHPVPLYSEDSDSFYGDDALSLYDQAVFSGYNVWYDGMVVDGEEYIFRVTIGSGPIQGKIITMSVIVDAPDLIEDFDNMSVSGSGSTIVLTQPFTYVKNIQATLQANGTGAETVEIDKTINLAPIIRAYNSSHSLVAGSTVDLTVKGY